LIFNKYDEDSDGRISLTELRQMILSESFTRDIPDHTVRQIMKRADEDANGYIEYPEFLRMVGCDLMEELHITFIVYLNHFSRHPCTSADTTLQNKVT
jgi:hypothetical protein